MAPRLLATVKLRIALGIACGALTAFPSALASEGCQPQATSLVIRGDGFRAIRMQVRAGHVRIGSLEFSLAEDGSWSVARAGGATPGESAGESPATQFTVFKSDIEIRSLDRRLGAVDEAPDAVLSIAVGKHGSEIHVAARGSATIEIDGRAGHAGHAPKELAFGCDGISLLSSQPSVI